MWVMTWQGQELRSDDLTLEELGIIEDETGIPWSVLNPVAKAAVARAFLRVLFTRSGLDPAQVDGLPLGAVKSVFAWRDDEPWPGGDDGEDDAGPPGRSSGDSSRGASAVSTGRRKKPERSG